MHDIDIDAVLLVGGMGTRLRAVLPSTPKPLASLGSQKFLELLVRQLRSQGIRRIVMSTGYLADQIEHEFGDGKRFDAAIRYSRETQPLGTAGAVKLASHYLKDSPMFLVMNGDSFSEADFRRLIGFHRERGGLVTMAVRRVENSARYGTVRINNESRVTGFSEKTGNTTPGTINAGVYVFSRAIFEHIPEGNVSLEREVFPKILPLGVYALEQQGIFIDIGTPEDYARAQALCDQLSDAASRG